MYSGRSCPACGPQADSPHQHDWGSGWSSRSLPFPSSSAARQFGECTWQRVRPPASRAVMCSPKKRSAATRDTASRRMMQACLRAARSCQTDAQHIARGAAHGRLLLVPTFCRRRLVFFSKRTEARKKWLREHRGSRQRAAWFATAAAGQRQEKEFRRQPQPQRCAPPLASTLLLLHSRRGEDCGKRPQPPSPTAAENVCGVVLKRTRWPETAIVRKKWILVT